VFLAAVACVAGFQLLPGPAAGPKDQDDLHTAPPTDETWLGDFRGYALQMHNVEPDHPYKQYIDEIAEADANTVMLVVKGFQENADSTSIFIDLRRTPSDRRIGEVIDHAHEKGLRVVLMPILLLDNARSKEWRGKIGQSGWSEQKWDDWWARYREFILHYAKLARAHDVELYIVGSELVSTEHKTDRWRELIASVRAEYGGLLSYSANWDHYDVAEFWDDLDAIGITSYYDLSGGREPTLETLMEAWKPIMQKILAWQTTVGKPILFTEVGWPNQETCAQYPWNYYAAPNKPDVEAQSNCFESFFRTWGHRPEVAGVLVWEWRSFPGQSIGPKDTSYVPCGKPALNVIRKYYAAAESRALTTEPATLPAAEDELVQPKEREPAATDATEYDIHGDGNEAPGEADVSGREALQDIYTNGDAIFAGPTSLSADRSTLPADEHTDR
jgi:hypothetical protein